MASDLANHIQQTAVADTHEHLRKETHWVEQGPPDVLADLFRFMPAPTWSVPVLTQRASSSWLSRVI